MPMPTLSLLAQVEPLAGRDLLIVLAVIFVVVAAVLLAGFGYFTPSDKD